MPEKPPKPIIFFSHSTRDAIYLKLLKELFCLRTNGTIDVFLSCDGESIRFGSNWSWRIEDAAKNCELMFAFLSPHSLTSKWVYFETGFALASAKTVIPIGINGVDPGECGPPLSQLQGFRLHSTDTLNNILAVINQHFDWKYALDFTDQDYASIESLSASTAAGPFGELNPLIARVEVDLIDPNLAKADKDQSENAFRKVMDVLSLLHVKFDYKPNNLRCLGMRAFLHSPAQGTIRFVAAPSSLGTTFSQLAAVIRRFDEQNAKPFAVRVVFESNVGLMMAPEEITGRLMPLGIELENNGWYSLENVQFYGRNFSSREPIGCDLAVMRKDEGDLTLADVVNIVRTYWAHGLLFTAA